MPSSIAIDHDGGLVYSTYLGTNAAGDSESRSIRWARRSWSAPRRSANFPTTPGVLSSRTIPGSIGAPLVGFVTKLNSLGTGLVFSSFIGLSDGGWPNAVALDPSSNVYISGGTSTGINFNTQSCAPFLCGFVVELDNAWCGAGIFRKFSVRHTLRDRDGQRRRRARGRDRGRTTADQSGRARAIRPS